VSGEFGALLVKEIDPVALPAEVGVKIALNVELLPAAIVSGTARPLVLNPAPVTVTAEIVTLAVPPFERLIVCELLVPMTTLPKLTFEGLAANCG
jgi:hypothetical protein